MTEASTDFDSIDFFTDKSLVVDPFPYYDHLRERAPVQREPHHGVVMVTGYDEAVEVYRDSETFSSCISVSGPFPGFPVPLEGDIPALIEKHRHQLPMNDQLPTFDPPEHGKHRALLMRLITPNRLKENEEFMWRLVEGQLGEIVKKQRCEFVSEFASPIALLVIADLLGVPDADREEFRAMLAAPKPGKAVGSVNKDVMSANPLDFLYRRFSEYIEDRRKSPQSDVLTGMARATFPDGSTPEVIDVVRVAANLFAAGQETTVRLLAAALQIIAERPGLEERLRSDRALIPNFIEETLRVESPVKGDFRLAKAATKIGGVDIPAGTMVMVLNGAANHDPRQFENPGEFDPERKNARQHLAFGLGIHSCPGAPLARAEARISLEKILDSMKDIRICESEHGPPGARRFQYAPTYILRGLQRLWLEYTPVA
jgi:cytochrome P450